MKERCENCWYYQRKYNRVERTDENPHPVPPEEYAGEGECRRFPPQVVARSPNELMIGGPPVLGNEWCGEWVNGEEKAQSRNRSYGAE